MLGQRLLYYCLMVTVVLLSFINRDLTPVNELKYISIALESIRSNHWFALYNHGDIYADKPPIYFWIIIFGIKLFNTEGAIIWTLLFSLLPAIANVEILYRWTKNELAPTAGLAGVLMLMSSVLFLGSALVLRMDMLMSFFITMSLYQFYLAYQRYQQYQQISPQRYLILLFILLAIFVKGPMGLALPVLSIVVFLTQKKLIRDIGIYFPLKGILLCALICGLWLYAVYIEAGKQYLYELTIDQAVRRGVNASVHLRPMYYYLQYLFATLLPWSLLVLAALFSCFRQQKKVTDLNRLFITTALTGLVMLSLVSSKLLIYLLPVMPFIIFSTLILLTQSTSLRPLKWGLYPIAILAILLPIATLSFPQLTATLPIMQQDLIILLAVIFITGAIALIYLGKNKPMNAIKVISLGMAVILLVTAVLIPRYNHLLGVRALALAAPAQSKLHNNSAYYSYSFHSARNLDVYLNRSVTNLTTTAQLIQLPSGSIILTKHRHEQLEQIFNANNQPFTLITSFGRYRLYTLD